MARLQDRRVRDITLHDALSMKAGFDWQENGPSTWEWMRSASQVRFTLGSPLVAPPGQRFNYNSGVAHLIGVIVARATGKDLATYANQALFAPMGIDRVHWGRDKEGNYEGASEQARRFRCDCAGITNAG